LRRDRRAGLPFRTVIVRERGQAVRFTKRRGLSTVGRHDLFKRKRSEVKARPLEASESPAGNGVFAPANEATPTWHREWSRTLDWRSGPHI